jgi:hypothetical protein
MNVPRRQEWVYQVPMGSRAARAVRKLEHIPATHFAALGVVRTLQGTWFLFALDDELTDDERAEVTAAFSAAGAPALLDADQVLSLPLDIYASGPPTAVVTMLRTRSIY